MLQGALFALKELASIAQGMNGDFTAESQDLVREVQSHLDAFGEFSDQQQRIRSLQDRIGTGSMAIQGLSHRLDIVHERIDGWERADREWQERTRKRLKIIWTVMSVAVFFVILLFISAQYVPEGLEGATVRLANESISKFWNSSAGSHPGSWDPGQNETSRLQNMLNRTGSGAALEDDRLRAFDEL